MSKYRNTDGLALLRAYAKLVKKQIGNEIYSSAKEAREAQEIQNEILRRMNNGNKA
jgi:hypothetical protein